MKRVMMSMVGAAMAIAAGGAFAVDDAAAHDSAGMNAGTYAQTGSDRGGVKVVFLGNSITLHGPCAKIGWTNNWGMAASAAEKDYVHLVAQGVAREFGRRADIVRIQNLCEWEKNYRTYDFSQLDDVVALKPDVLVVALGENTPHFTNEADQVAFRDSFKRLLGRFMENRDLKPLSVVRGCWWPSEGSRRKDEAMAHAASDFAIPFVKADLWGDPGMDASNGEFSHPGVQAHPGDRGMAEIANRILEGLFPTKSGYEATVDGTYARVRPIRVSAMEYNRWPKDWYQRPVDQAEVAGMVTVESDGATDWRVRAERKFSKAVVRPLSAGVKPVVADGEVRFTLPKPGHYTLELDDAHSPLQMFVEPKRDFAAERKAATISFGPGRHLAGVVRLKSHDRVFLDKDAFVYGSFAVDDAEDVMISGYGVICGTLGNRLSVDLALFADCNATPIRARNSKRLRIDGPTIVDSVGWNISTFGCADVEIAHVKVTGAWRYNTDGIDICNCENVRLRDSFIHSFDDAVVLKGLLPYRALPERNIRVERCVCWCGWGGTLENGLETWASAWDGIVFEDCDLIHNSMSAMRLHLGGPCALGDVTYRNIRIEYDATERAPEGQASRDAKYSHRRDAPWTGNWLTVRNAKMYRPGSTYVNKSVDPNEPCGVFRQLTLEDIDITVDDGVPRPAAWVCFEPGTALGRITAKGVRVNGVECPLEGAGKIRALRGEVGSRLDAMMRNNIERIDWGYLDFPFTQKTETGSWKVIQPGIWQTEFWGKYMQAAVPLALYAGDEALKARIGESVKRVLATQQADGYIGNYRPENRGTVCDVWGVKYVMMGLLHWFDATGDKTALDGAARLADWLMSVAGPGKMSLGATGPFGGLMNCSVLEPVVWLYRRTGGRKYLEYAKWIVSELDTNAKGPELVPQALKGVPVRERHPERDGHKAYEMMSCCQGLLDYYEETGDRRVLEAVVRSAENIVADEIDICGGGTRGERFAGTAKAQTTDGFRGSETCVLITWMRLCEKLCEVTGEPRWADELERTFFNAYLGQLARDGSTFASYEGLAGVRERRHPLQCRMEANCCSANGPRGFLSFMGSAASAKGDVITVNQYVFGHVDVPCAAVNGGNIRLDSFTEYPRVMRYAVTLAFRDPAEFTLRFRAPAWSARTAVRTSSGETAESKGGEYITLRRIWKPGDQIEVTFDDRVVPHHLNGFVAFTRGPLALARDIRFADGDLAEAVCGKELRFEEKLPPDAAMYMSVGGKISLCDYASAGNTKDGKSTYRVWLPEKER